VRPASSAARAYLSQISGSEGSRRVVAPQRAVGNAIKFTDAGEVRITASAANGHFAVSVSDTGPGIPPEERERIFEKFRQVDSSNTRAKGGTGLGLAIAREIVEMHGGRIWVESKMGQGSTFRIWSCPCVPQSPSVQHEQTHSCRSSASGVVQTYRPH